VTVDFFPVFSPTLPRSSEKQRNGAARNRTETCRQVVEGKRSCLILSGLARKADFGIFGF
jgi:hypothetical protein